MIKVYGDIMLDRWIIGTADRVSPEADVLVLNEKHQKFNLGGAANLAVNLKHLDNDVELYGSIGKDKEGLRVLKLLAYTDITVNLSNDSEITTTKTRLVGDTGQHLLRWDSEKQYYGDEAWQRLKTNYEDNDIIVILSLIHI